MESQLKKWLKELRLNESTISMILGGLVVVVVGILVYNYFANVGKQPTELTEATPSGELMVTLPTTHKVVKGEDLSMIAKKYYGSGERWTLISEANKLTNPNTLVEGQELLILASEVAISPAPSVAPSAAPTIKVIEDKSYTVLAGEGLWQIAVRAYQDGYQWTKIYEANKAKISNPNQLEKGMVLIIPR